MKKMVTKKAFTMAEILVVLGIIGFVVVFVIMPLIDNFSTEKFRSSLKKEYSTLTQTVNMLQAENKSIDTSSADNFVTDLATKIKIVKRGTWGSITTLPSPFHYKCYKAASGVCGNNGDGISIWSRPTYDGYSAFVESNGALFLIRSFATQCNSAGSQAKIRPADTLPTNNICAAMFLDLNGDKAPNQLGVDAHYFYLLRENNNYYIRFAGENLDTICQKGYPEDYNKSMHCTNRMLMNEAMP